MQRIAVTCHLGLVVGNIAARGLQRGLVLRQHQPIGSAQRMHALGQLVAAIARRQRVAGQLQALLVGRQRQPSIGDVGNQAQLHHAAAFLSLQILLQCRLTQIAHAAP